jgi:hypothetical protein
VPYLKIILVVKIPITQPKSNKLATKGIKRKPMDNKLK